MLDKVGGTPRPFVVSDFAIAKLYRTITALVTMLISIPLFAPCAKKLFSPEDFSFQVGQQELSIVMFYHGKDRHQRDIMDSFKRACKVPEVKGAIAFMYADLDKYDLDEIATSYKLSQFPAYLIFQGTKGAILGTAAGRPLNAHGVVTFIMQHAEKEITKIREQQVRQAELRAREAEARAREMNARYPNVYVGVGWGYPGWGYPGWGYGYPYYGWGYGRGRGVHYYRVLDSRGHR